MRQNAILLAASSLAMPTAIAAAGVRAESRDPVVLIAQINEAVTAMRTQQATMQSEIDSFAMRGATDRLGDPSARGVGAAVDPEYSQPFSEWFRTGAQADALRSANATGYRAQIRASLNEGANSEGGYLAPTEWDRRIEQSLVSVSPLRRLSDVRKTTVSAYSTLWKVSGPGTGWVGETASRPATATPIFAPIIFGHGEIYAQPAATQRMLDDSQIDLAGWLAGELNIEFTKQEGIAFLTGDGVNKPNGLLLHGTGGSFAAFHPAGAIVVAPSGSAATLTIDGLVDFHYGLPAPYRQNATWLMNSKTAAAIAKMKDGQGNFIWRESFAVGQPSTLLGRPVEIDENMPDVAAGNTPIVFGDFRAGYVINDRQGTNILRDPYTAKPFVLFYATRRVGGGVKDPNAFRILKIAAS